MNSKLAFLFGLGTLSALTVPPSDGKFFYLEVDRDLDKYMKSDKDDYSYMYHANILAGEHYNK